YRVDIPSYSRRMVVRRRSAGGPGLHVTPADGLSLDVHGPPGIQLVYGIRGDEVLVLYPEGTPGRLTVMQRKAVWGWIGSDSGLRSDLGFTPGPGAEYGSGSSSGAGSDAGSRAGSGTGHRFVADSGLEDVLRRRTANQLGMAGREPGSPATRSTGDTLVFVLCRGAPAAFCIDDVPARQVRTTTIYSTYVHWK